MIERKTNCPHCKEEVTVKLKGKEPVKCPKCQKKFTPKGRYLPKE